MPKIWRDTMENHRQALRNATLDATAALVAEHGLSAVTMSRIAEETGIGRATLYKYFPDVEAILLAWHERHIASHFEHLAAIRERSGSAYTALESVLHAFANMSQHAEGDISAMLHRSRHALEARKQLLDLVADLVDKAGVEGHVRSDIPADELAAYAMSALSGAAQLPGKASVERLVEVVLAGMKPQA